MGDYLPDDEATLQEEQTIVRGKDIKEAEEACKQEASQYDAIDAGVEETEEDGDWLCKFKFWG